MTGKHLRNSAKIKGVTRACWFLVWCRCGMSANTLPHDVYMSLWPNEAHIYSKSSLVRSFAYGWLPRLTMPMRVHIFEFAWSFFFYFITHVLTVQYIELVCLYGIRARTIRFISMKRRIYSAAYSTRPQARWSYSRILIESLQIYTTQVVHIVAFKKKNQGEVEKSIFLLFSNSSCNKIKCILYLCIFLLNQI